MISIRTDYNDFAKRFSHFLMKRNESLVVDVVSNNDIRSQFCDTTYAPISCNPITRYKDAYVITCNVDLIKECELIQNEVDACILREIGHLIKNNNRSRNCLEIDCDKLAIEANMALPMLSSLYKMQAKLGVDMHDRISAISSKMHIYRAVWTCGRYNKDKKVAIMYNLIAGYSYFFEGYSANVIGEILTKKRGKDVDVMSIASNTGICMESLCKFFFLLIQCGLLEETIPTEESVASYRKILNKVKKSGQSWVDKSTDEKLPMDVSNAEQAYFSAVDNGKTICSCMFELTYRCSEICIHCYNPGATRNDTEISYRTESNELGLDDYKHIVDDLCANGLVKVCLSGGDPFSKEFVWGLLDYLYEKEIAVDVFTNGQRLIKNVKRLADYYPRLVGVSIYSGVAEDHDVITRVPGSWEKTMQVVRELADLAVPMNFKCCVMQPNLHTYYMVSDLARKYGAVPQFEINISESNDGDICAKQLRLTEEQLQVVLRDNNLSLYVGKEAPNYGGQKRDLASPSCGAGNTGFCMSPNGDLRACASFTQTYGNLRTQSVGEILTCSPELKDWRNAVISDYVECGHFNYCEYCNLCAGINYTEHGDFRKPAETNCYMAKCRYNLARKLMETDVPLSRGQFIEALQKLTIKEVKLQRMYRIKG